MSQILNSVTFYEFEPFYPEHLPFKNDEHDWEIYAAAVRKIMLAKLKIKDSDSGFRDVIEFEKFISEYNKNSKKTE
jgi:hypothetical protein